MNEMQTQEERPQIGSAISGQSLVTMRESALSHPRDEEQVMAAALKELEFVPELASKSYYSIPYNQGKINETRVEGPSIKAAMALARRWGNCLTGATIKDEDGSNYFVEGYFVDLESLYSVMRPIKVSKFYKPRGSDGLLRLDHTALYNAVQSGCSKAARNAALSALPVWLVDSYYQRAKQLVITPLTKQGQIVASIQDRITKCKASIMKSFKVTPEQMQEYLASAVDSIEDEGQLLAHLVGIYNGLFDNRYKAEEVFGKPPTVPMEPQPKDGGK